jgi:glycosyltransferase involved in cell wall biosynthesis
MEAEIIEMAEKIPNLTFLGFVSPEESSSLTCRASVFVNTSIVEGFPNTLLEAASAGTAYVSFVDPDEVICQYALGTHVSSIEELVESVRRISGDEALRRQICRNGRDYIAKYHNADRIADAYSELFEAGSMRW